MTATTSESRGGLWRWAERLPTCQLSSRVTLGEGGTPLIELTEMVGLAEVRVWMKCEHLNPTGSFKDRIAAVAVSLVRERSLRGLLGTSSGNGGAAAAAYAARAGCESILMALPTAPPEKLLQMRAVGATIRPVDGLGSDAVATEHTASWIVRHASSRGYLPFLTGAKYSPEIMVGARTIAYELAEQCPTATHIYAPVGGGGLYASLWRGYCDVGSAAPQLVAVQPVGCPTVRSELAGGGGRLPLPATTAISGLQMASLFDGDIATAMGGSGGHLVEVEDEQIYDAQRDLAAAGILVEPAGAAALAGARKDVQAGRIGQGDTVVLMLTGAGWKDKWSLEQVGNHAIPRPVPPWISGLDSGRVPPTDHAG